MNPIRKHASQGQSSVEYLVVCAAFAFALGIGMSSDESALKQLLVGFQMAYKNIAFAISIP